MLNSISIMLGMPVSKCALRATPPGENAGEVIPEIYTVGAYWVLPSSCYMDEVGEYGWRTHGCAGAWATQVHHCSILYIVLYALLPGRGGHILARTCCALRGC